MVGQVEDKSNQRHNIKSVEEVVKAIGGRVVYPGGMTSSQVEIKQGSMDVRGKATEVEQQQSSYAIPVDKIRPAPAEATGVVHAEQTAFVFQ